MFFIHRIRYRLTSKSSHCVCFSMKTGWNIIIVEYGEFAVVANPIRVICLICSTYLAYHSCCLLLTDLSFTFLDLIFFKK